MAYTKQGFRSGDKLFAKQLNAMDDQIAANTAMLDSANDETANLRPFGSCYFDYSGTGFYIGNTDDETAKALAKYDLICLDGVFASRTQSDERDRQIAIIRKIKSYNENCKFFRYISYATYNDADGNKVDQTKAKMFDEIHWTAHLGGTDTGTKDSSGYEVYTGGYSIDGIFWDEFGSTAACGDGLDWAYEIDKSIDVITETHNSGLSAFGNVGNGVDHYFGGATDAQNPDGKVSAFGENDFWMYESKEFYYNADWSEIYWSGDSDVVLNYALNYYPAFKTKCVCFSSANSALTNVERQLELTWMIYSALTQGANYVCHEGGFTIWEMPESVSLFRTPKDEVPNITKLGDGWYQLKANGHTLQTYRPASLAGQLVKESTFNKSWISIDGVRFRNDISNQGQLNYYAQDRIAAVEDTLTNMTKDNRKNSSSYIRMVIDDWKTNTSYLGHTNYLLTRIGENTSEALSGVSLRYAKDVTNDSVDIYYTVTEAWATPKLYFDAVGLDFSEITGHRFEFSCEAMTKADGTDMDTYYPNLVLYAYGDTTNSIEIFPRTQNQSLFEDNDRPIAYYIVIPENCTSLAVEIKVRDVSSGEFLLKNCRFVDVDEFTADTTKENYTNLIPKNFFGWSYASAEEDAATITVLDAHSANVVWDMEKSYDWYSGIWMYLTDNLKPGHTYEFGCKTVTMTNENVRLGIWCTNLETNILSYTAKSTSSATGESVYCQKFTVSSDLPESFSAFFRMICTTPWTPYVENEDGTKSPLEMNFSDVYLYDLDEENVIVRGRDLSNSYLRICRVTDEKLSQDTHYVNNSLYITDTGKMYITNIDGSELIAINCN